MRYRLNAPELAPRLLRLPGLSRAAQTAWPVETGGGYAWVSVKDGGAEYVCVAVSGGRLVVDRRRGDDSSCR